MIAAPTDIADLRLWLTAQGGNNFMFGSGTAVASWLKQSGNGNHAVQETATNKPMVVTSEATRWRLKTWESVDWRTTRSPVRY